MKCVRVRRRWSRGEVWRVCKGPIQWGGDKGGVEWREVKMVCSRKGSQARMSPCHHSYLIST